MATLTVRNLDDDVVKRLRVRAAEHGRSAEAEHREILRSTLLGGELEARADVATRLAEFRRRTAGRGSPPSAELLDEARANRVELCSGDQDGCRIASSRNAPERRPDCLTRMLP